MTPLTHLSNHRRTIAFCAIAFALLLLGGGWWLYRIRPAEPLVAPDSPEAWRGLMQNKSRPVRLAAAILLAGKGDHQGTSALLKEGPSLSPRELSIALRALLAIADTTRLDPALIDLFLDAAANPRRRAKGVVSPGFEIIYGISASDAGRLVPPGGEKLHLVAMRKAFERALEENGLNASNPESNWDLLERLIASKDRDTLLFCERLILKSVNKSRSVKVPVNAGFYRVWAALVLNLHGKNPSGEFDNLPKDYPAECIPQLRQAFARGLGRPWQTYGISAPSASGLSSYAAAASCRNSRVPWALRRNRTQTALRDARELQAAMAAYFVDYSHFPPRLQCLTTPIAYVPTLRPDICAWKGDYVFASSPWNFDYALASTGPDGVHDISLLHFLLAEELTGREFGKPLAHSYVRLSRHGYEPLEASVAGSDIVTLYDRSVFDKKQKN